METGALRDLIEEKSETFIWTAHTENLGLERVNWLDQTEEIIYASEQDGWRHLYLIDIKSTEPYQRRNPAVRSLSEKLKVIPWQNINLQGSLKEKDYIIRDNH